MEGGVKRRGGQSEGECPQVGKIGRWGGWGGGAGCPSRVDAVKKGYREGLLI